MLIREPITEANKTALRMKTPNRTLHVKCCKLHLPISSPITALTEDCAKVLYKHTPERSSKNLTVNLMNC